MYPPPARPPPARALTTAGARGGGGRGGGGVAGQCMELGLTEALLTLCIATALFYLVLAI